MQQAACNIKVLILLYSKERQAYLGFIPNDQVGFVDRIRKVIQTQKQQQQTARQGQVFPGASGLMPGQQPTPGMVQGQQPGMVQNQPGMLSGSPVPQPGLVQAQQTPISSLAQQLGQAQQLQQQLQQQQQQVVQNSGNPSNPELSHIELERQQNLLTIQQVT